MTSGFQGKERTDPTEVKMNVSHFLQELCSQAIVVHVHKKAHKDLSHDVLVGTFCAGSGGARQRPVF